MVSPLATTVSKTNWADELAAERVRCQALEAKLAALERVAADAQQATQRRETELLAVLGALPMATVLLDEDNQVRFVNQACRNMFGLATNSLQRLNAQRNASGLLAFPQLLADPESVRARVRALWAGNKTSLNNDFTLADGRVVSLDYLVLEDAGAGRLLCCRDVTAQRRDGEQLTEQQMFCEDALMNLPGGVSVLDANLRYLFVNAAVEPDPGLRAALVGANTAEGNALRGRSQPMAEQRQQRLEQAVQQRREVTWEEKLVHSTGERCWLVSAQPLFGPDGALRMVILSGVDITDRLRVEQKMAHQREFYEAIQHEP
ncbi:MAG: PAS domain-containing protein [Janthinobacterium lividum]